MVTPAPVVTVQDAVLLVVGVGKAAGRRIRRVSMCNRGHAAGGIVGVGRRASVAAGYVRQLADGVVAVIHQRRAASIQQAESSESLIDRPVLPYRVSGVLTDTTPSSMAVDTVFPVRYATLVTRYQAS